MTKFGRFEFKATEPAELFEGDFMEFEKGYVKIFEGNNGDLVPRIIQPRLVAAIHLDSGQSVREMKEPETPKREGKSKRKAE
jgi:hypothetical protein